MGRILGGPYDGGDARRWREPLIAAPIPGGRWAVYERDAAGDYRFVRTYASGEIKVIEPGEATR